MPGKCIHLQATSKGAGNIRLTFGDNTHFCWTLRGFYIQFATTFTDICTVSYKFCNHENTSAANYDVVVYEATVATAAGVVQHHMFPPSSMSFARPVFRGGDACLISIGGASAANAFNYVAVLQEL
jgi:hypothetical protein